MRRCCVKKPTFCTDKERDTRKLSTDKKSESEHPLEKRKIYRVDLEGHKIWFSIPDGVGPNDFENAWEGNQVYYERRSFPPCFYIAYDYREYTPGGAFYFVAD